MHFLHVIAFIALLYFFVHFLYSVQYVGGPALYGSPVTQALFPTESPMIPSWGYDILGFLHGDPTKYGRGSYWPSFKPYEPTKSASGGLHPNGGMRETSSLYPGVVLREGFASLPTLRHIHDEAEIPSEKTWPVGWWGSFSWAQ